jgi:hypothetical protein
MKRAIRKLPVLLVVGLLGTAAVALEAQTQAPTDTTVAPQIVTGEVVRYEPGKVLVVRGANGEEVIYALSPKVQVQQEVQVGRTVSVHIERGKDGATAVTRVTSTTVTPEGQVKRTTEETRIKPSGETTTSQVSTVTGEVVRYVPERTIVLREAPGKETSFDLRPGATVPTAIQVGQKVTLYTEPGPSGTASVARVTTTSINPEGQVERKVEETRIKPSGETTKTTSVTVEGMVEAYQPGKSITVRHPDGSRFTYILSEGARLPDKVLVGKTISIRNVPVVETVVVEKD